MVGSLEVPPVLLQTAVAGQAHALAGGIELVGGLALERIADPGGSVAGFVGSRDGVYDGQFADGFQLADRHRGCPEFDAAFGSEAWESFEELEDAGLGRLHGSECLEVEAQGDDLLFLGCGGDPVDILVGGERIGFPGGVAEALGDVLDELRVVEQQLQLRSRCGGVYVVGRFPAKDVLGAFGDASLEAHGQDLRGEFVAVNEFGVAQHLGLDAEQGLDLLALSLDLLFELLGVEERRQRVRVGGGGEFHAACLGQLLQQVDEFGYVYLELLQGYARHGYRAAEYALGLLDHAQQRLGGRDVALLSQTGDDVVVEEVVVVVVVIADVEEAVAFEPEGLMYLEVKIYSFHFSGLVYRLFSTLLYMSITFWPALSQVMRATSARPSSRSCVYRAGYEMMALMASAMASMSQ